MSQSALAAANVASAGGYRTGIAVLNLDTGEYVGAGDDSGAFASESVAKVLIATELLATGQMTGTVEQTAYQMITESDDDDADDLYGLAGGDNVINLVSQRYNIPFLGTPPAQSGWWGNTEISAKGMVYLYAAILKDPVVGPWLTNAMAHTTETAADGTDQFFGIPSATTGAAVKQGWGDDGNDSPNAIFNSTGYVNSNHFAVAILTDGNSSTYGTPISNMVTSEAQTLMPGGQVSDPASHNPQVAALAVTTTGSTVQVSGTAVDPDAPTAPVTVKVEAQDASIATTTTDPATHAFSATFAAEDGSHAYDVVAQNIGQGTADAIVAAKPVTVDGDPSGAISSVQGGSQQIRITGTEVDPNLADGKPAHISVSIDGGQPILATVKPTGVSSEFDVVVPATAGSHTVALSFVHSADGRDVAEGSWPVSVTADVVQRTEHDVLTGSRDLDAIVVSILGVLAIAFGIRRRQHASARS